MLPLHIAINSICLLIAYLYIRKIVNRVIVSNIFCLIFFLFYVKHGINAKYYNIIHLHEHKRKRVCKSAGCNQVFFNPHILPFGNRTCASHIEAMVDKSNSNDNDDDTNNNIMVIECHFCTKMHRYPGDGEEGFPLDKHIHLLLKVKHEANTSGTPEQVEDGQGGRRFSHYV